MNILDKIKEGILRNPAAPAFIYRDRIMTGAQFYAFLSVVAKRLHEKGIVPGDVIGVSMDHSPLHCAVLLGLARLGAISLPLHPGSPLQARTRLAAKFGVKKIVTIDKVKDVEDIEAIRLGDLNFSGEGHTLDFIDYVPDENTPARIALTSGTTGEPSGILYTHGYWINRIAKTVDDIDSSSRVIPVDMHLALGNLFAFGALFAGGTVVFQRAYTLQDFVAAINLHAVTHILMPPATASAIVQHLPRTGIAFPTLKHMRMVGGALPASLLEILRTRFSPNVYHPFGISEIGAITMATPEILAAHPGCSGVTRPGVTIEIVDENGERVAAGQSGEIRIILEGMPTSYYLEGEKSAVRFKDGWYYTGDNGHYDDNGLLYVEGREDDKINVAGRKFNPTRIEEALVTHPDVSDAVVFSHEMQNGSSIIAAAVVSEKREVARELPEFCKKLGMGNMAPQRFYVVKELPRNPAGKLMRSSVPEMFKRPERPSTPELSRRKRQEIPQKPING